MKKLIIVLILAAVGVSLLLIARERKIQDKSDLIQVETPKRNEIVASPLLVKGRARGYWYFEASFPIKVEDEKGNIIAIKPAQAKGEWMTREFVPFEAILEFDESKTRKGFLILEKDNPSGLPEQADRLVIPVRF